MKNVIKITRNEISMKISTVIKDKSDLISKSNNKSFSSCKYIYSGDYFVNYGFYSNSSNKRKPNSLNSLDFLFEQKKSKNIITESERVY